MMGRGAQPRAAPSSLVAGPYLHERPAAQPSSAPARWPRAERPPCPPALCVWVAQVITSPFVYPLFTWSLQVQACVYTAVMLYIFVAALALNASSVHDVGPPRQPMAMISIIIFFIFGWVYVVGHFTLQSIAFVKVFLGREGAWQVTARRTSSGTTPPQARPTGIAAAEDGAASASASSGGVGGNTWAWQWPPWRQARASTSVGLAPLAEPLLR